MKFFQTFSAICILVVSACYTVPVSHAVVSIPNIFSDHMVLQQKQANIVWGKSSPGEKVTVRIKDHEKQTTADEDGNWSVKLDPLDAGGPYELLVVGSNTITITDVLVGEVWICSGQSNMEWSVNKCSDSDLVKATANYPFIRMVNYPNKGSQEPAWTHLDAHWRVCSSETVGNYSAVGYFFGRELHQALNVPIGLINNSWGGSAAEAWVNREVLEETKKYHSLLEPWQTLEDKYKLLSNKADKGEEEQKQLASLSSQMIGNSRPGNLYNGILKSHLGYGIQGVIWYQGESNVDRAHQYRDLFPLMITNWRDEWNQGDFPFYWVQLANYLDEQPEPGESAWAELREAQTLTMSKLSNTGEAVIIDVGEGKDIHPRNKLTVGQRLARWALANQYGKDIAYHSPSYNSFEMKDGKIILTFDQVHNGWRTFDVNKPIGFAIAGADEKFVWADAKIVEENRIEVSSSKVVNPVAVRYAWADNPVCNMFDGVGLPLTPFRTDDWPGVTVDNQ
ncbi:sialate O-acetylesterase [Bythopirellula goksoeyrii]|uniref:Sialate O-acetylesterase domain-containing protein n=1 Tax=Bythopirellula goksoeyrii TaxID=1400387 RepID=A0A5B9QH39_9BACT|nr:sialate O-acetylesterase [Bythopirellula goksoeyrii]QEG36266.1 hypothetical protein Pr1d_35780 [Bythopirellula goksoeyrii]